MRTKSDDTIKQRVLDQIRWQPGVDDTNIGVTVHEGNVSLFGHVDTFVEREEAIKAAWRVRGVKAVADEIDIKHAGSDTSQ